MRGRACPFINLLSNVNKRLVIPLYQRNYDWKESQCAQLFDDLLRMCDQDYATHFFGSIVSAEPGYTDEVLIIDGQQRITTISLLLAALANATHDGEIEAGEEFYEKITESYLWCRYPKRAKLVPIQKDRSAFEALLKGERGAYDHTSSVTRNYEYLYDRIVQSGLSADSIFRAVERLHIIRIELERDDDAQLIFESLNSTGLALNEADKIRNYLLMSASTKEQEELYTDYWNPIELATNYEVSPFVRDYLTLKTGKIVRADDVYFKFKEFAEHCDMDRRALLVDMLKYARLYRKIDVADFGHKDVDRVFSQLRTLESRVAYPFFMMFLAHAEAHAFSPENIREAAVLIESYWVRRIICNLPSNGLNKVFATLHTEVLKLCREDAGPDGTHYLEILKFVLLRKRGTTAFPQDNEVRSNFKTREVYKISVASRTFLLERLENRDSLETHDVPQLLADRKLSVEHIMPQKLSPKWKADLGENWEEIHDRYLHTLANLTLTAYNSKYGNASFIEKRDMENGFRHSALRLNTSLAKAERWTEKEMKARQSELLDVFLKLWPTPHTDFIPARHMQPTLTLDAEDEEVTGQKLQAYEWAGVRYTAVSWKEMLIAVVGQLYAEHRTTIDWLAANGKHHLYVKPMSDSTEVVRGIFLYTDNSTTTKFRILRELLQACGRPTSELIFELA